MQAYKIDRSNNIEVKHFFKVFLQRFKMLFYFLYLTMYLTAMFILIPKVKFCYISICHKILPNLSFLMDNKKNQ